MTSTDHEGAIVVVAEKPAEIVVDKWESILSRQVRRIDPDDLPIGGEESIRGVLVELDDPDSLRRSLVELRDVDVPVVVAPRTGAETLAAIALRYGASEYVSPTVSENPTEEIRAAFRSKGSATNGPSVNADRLHRIVATTLPDETFVIDEDGRYLEATVRPESGDMYTVSAADLVGSRLEEVFPSEEARRLQACIDTALETDAVRTIEYETETTEGTKLFEGKVVPVDGRIAGKRAVVWLARDVTERAVRERRLRRRRDHLETQDRINAIVRRVIQTLIDAPNRREIERDVCEHLVESDLYNASWIVELTGEDVTYRTDSGDFDTCLGATIGHENVEAFAITAIRTDEIQVIDAPFGTEAGDDADDGWTLLAVPLSYDEVVYGALVVCACRPDAFSIPERKSFRILGETIGFAINALKNEHLLFADTVVELEFHVPRGEAFTLELTEQYECTCRLEWAGTTASGKTFQYVTIEGVDGKTAYEAAQDHGSIEECRLIHDGENGCTIEFRLRESAVRTLSNHGVQIRDITVDSGEGTLVVEVPRDADVRAIVEELQRIYEDATLVARREIDRSVQTAAERRQRILDRLTDRQLSALRIAYYSGYFEWPRGSTGEDVAEMMDISPPTLHQHLRKGLWEILHEFFEGGDVGPPLPEDD